MACSSGAGTHALSRLPQSLFCTSLKCRRPPGHSAGRGRAGPGPLCSSVLSAVQPHIRLFLPPARVPPLALTFGVAGLYRRENRRHAGSLQWLWRGASPSERRRHARRTRGRSVEPDAAQTLPASPPLSRPTGPGPRAGQADGQRKDGVAAERPALTPGSAPTGLRLCGAETNSHEGPQDKHRQRLQHRAVCGAGSVAFGAGAPLAHSCPKQHGARRRPGGSTSQHLQSTSSPPVHTEASPASGFKEHYSPLRGRRSQQACLNVWNGSHRGRWTEAPQRGGRRISRLKGPVASEVCARQRGQAHGE